MPFGNVYCAGVTPAVHHARKYLEANGITITDSPDWNTKHLLLDVPSFRPGLWTENSFDTLLSSLSNDITVWGGNLNHSILDSYRTIDLLKDETYLLENAHITADCTIPIAESLLKTPWCETSALIIGWGRITRFLSCKLKDLGCNVTISSRSLEHRAHATALGFRTTESGSPAQFYHLIINTAPAHILSASEDTASVYLDLASVRGIIGEKVVWARGLPGKYAPERSGKLIANTVLRLSKEVC